MKGMFCREKVAKFKEKPPSGFQRWVGLKGRPGQSPNAKNKEEAKNSRS